MKSFNLAKVLSLHYLWGFKKKEGLWYMCPDYRELNKMAIKDRFPIPIIDELLD